MKTDEQLRREVAAALAHNLRTQSPPLTVAVKRGAVRLVGETPTYAERWKAHQTALGVAGVNGVESDITVSLTRAGIRPDLEIARTIENVLWWTGYWRRNEIKVTVTHGWVTLSGEMEWDYQKRTAVGEIADVSGIAGVIDNTVLKFSRSGAPSQRASTANESV